ncbi:hypothetical protein ACFVQ4_29590 [Streptomyces laurentii]|uniref:hypothetical protein n=1 Tax=Streptomyces laurentii TaxID=39478 RepID=UPI00367BA4D6
MSAAERLWPIHVFAFALGTVNAVETPARMSFVSEMVGPELLLNAVSYLATVAGLLLTRPEELRRGGHSLGGQGGGRPALHPAPARSGAASDPWSPASAWCASVSRSSCR